MAFGPSTTYFLLDVNAGQFIAKATNKSILDKYAKTHLASSYLRINLVEDLDPIDDAMRVAAYNNLFGTALTAAQVPADADAQIFSKLDSLYLPLITKSVKDTTLENIPVTEPTAAPVPTPVAAVAVAPAPAAPVAVAPPVAAAPAPVAPVAAAPVAPVAVVAAPAPAPVAPVAAPVAVAAPVVAAPVPTPAPAPAAPAPVAAPVAAPEMIYPQPQEGDPSYDALIEVGWSDETLATSQYAYLIPHMSEVVPVEDVAVVAEDFFAYGSMWKEKFKAAGMPTRFGKTSKNCTLGPINLTKDKTGTYQVWTTNENAAHLDCCKGEHEPVLRTKWTSLQKLTKEQADTIVATYLAAAAPAVA